MIVISSDEFGKFELPSARLVQSTTRPRSREEEEKEEKTNIPISKIPGAPIMSVARGKYVIERLPDAPEK